MCLSVCPHYCTEPDVTWGSGKGCPLVVHYWADLQLVHGLHCYGNIMEMRSSNLPRPLHALRMPAKTPLASDKIDVPTCCMRDVICNEGIPFRPCFGGVVMPTRNVSKYMLVLALCLVTAISPVCVSV